MQTGGLNDTRGEYQIAGGLQQPLPVHDTLAVIGDCRTCALERLFEFRREKSSAWPLRVGGELEARSHPTSSLLLRRTRPCRCVQACADEADVFPQDIEHIRKCERHAQPVEGDLDPVEFRKERSVSVEWVIASRSIAISVP